MMFFAIRHKPTGGFMPQAATRRGGFTHDEPSVHFPPRMFTREQDAKCALTWWLKGVTSVTAGYNGWDGDYDEQWDTKMPTVDSEWMAERTAEDFEVVKVEITQQIAMAPQP